MMNDNHLQDMYESPSVDVFIIQNDGLGVYEGGFRFMSGVWRPTETSIMNDSSKGFNAPSREAIYYRIHKLAYGSEYMTMRISWNMMRSTELCQCQGARSL